MTQSVKIICDSISPSGKRITTMLIKHNRFIHPELLRHRQFNFSVASSRAIPYTTQRKQVENDPAMPVLWPKYHKGMQGAEVFESASHSNDNICAKDIEEYWIKAKDNALYVADKLSELGLSKQLANRLLEPWVTTRCVITATEWDNFFMLRNPHKKVKEDVESNIQTYWGDKIDLNFPAEYNIQDLAIKMRQALAQSTPNKLVRGEWHLPFVTDDDIESYTEHDQCARVRWDILIKLSAARCARTSYNKNMGKSINDDIKLADMLLKEQHFSPFEHQGKAIDFTAKDMYEHVVRQDDKWALPKGIELKFTSNGEGNYYDLSLWSRNFKNWIQARATLDK